MRPHFYKIKGKKAKCGKKKVVKKEKKKTKKCPALLRLLYFLPSSPVPTDLTIASVVSVLGYIYIYIYIYILPYLGGYNFF